MKTFKKRIFAAFMSLAVVISMIPALGSTLISFADDPVSATVYLTVSKEGEIAKANDGSLMAWKPVYVTDLNGDGALTYDEALRAAHETYNTADGYAAPNGYVSKLWGVTTYASLFFTNNTGLTTGVSSDTVSAGDFLVAAIMADDVYYSDYYSYFSEKTISAASGEAIRFDLEGYMGMSPAVSEALEGITLGYYTSDGTYTELSAVTADGGTATVSFDAPGVYYVSAKGVQEEVTVSDYRLMNAHDFSYTVDGTPFCTFDGDTYESFIAYTETDYGNGPYPANEILYTDLYAFDAEDFEYYPLYSNQVIVNAPLIAPLCTVVVAPPFTASVNGIVLTNLHYMDAAYSYVKDWSTGATENIGLFVVTVPNDTTAVDLAFSSNVLPIAYGLGEDYLNGYYDNYQVGTANATVKMDFNDNGQTDYIRVQTPYYEDPQAPYGESSDTLYAITFIYENPVTPPSPTTPAQVSKNIEDVYKAAREKVATLVDTKDEAKFGQEWLAMDLARDGMPVTGYYLEDVVREIKEKNGVLHTGKADYTNYARTVLALTALGIDASYIDGIDLIEKVADLNQVRQQGVNGVIYALLALDSGNYPLPSDSMVTRQDYINVILSAQLSDGGWDFANKKADPDLTAMALIALAPYYQSNANVKVAVDKALLTLSSLQQDDGGFQTEDAAFAESSESSSMVIMALLAFGIDPATDSRFVKNGVSALDNLCSFAVSGGGFKHTADGSYNTLATDQGYRALAAYYRMVNGLTTIYDMTDLTLTPIYGSLSEEIIVTNIVGAEDAEKQILNSPEVKGMNGKIDFLFEVIFAVVDEEGQIVGTIPEAAEEQEVSIILPPKALAKLGEDVLIAGVHNGKVVVIKPTSVDRKTGEVKFKGTLFSVYSVTSGKIVNPETGDRTNTTMWILLLSASVLMILSSVFAFKRRKCDK